MIHGTPVFRPTAILAAQFAYGLAPDPITDSIGPYSFSTYPNLSKIKKDHFSQYLIVTMKSFLEGDCTFSAYSLTNCTWASMMGPPCHSNKPSDFIIETTFSVNFCMAA
jgi:hypothetical protein